MKKDEKIWFSESWGEPIDVSLMNGKTLHLRCEFIRGDGWKITDSETGLLAQTKVIPTKKQLMEYIKDKDLLVAFSRITNTEYYARQKDELTEFLKKINETKNLPLNDLKIK